MRLPSSREERVRVLSRRCVLEAPGLGLPERLDVLVARPAPRTTARRRRSAWRCRRPACTGAGPEPRQVRVGVAQREACRLHVGRRERADHRAAVGGRKLPCQRDAVQVEAPPRTRGRLRARPRASAASSNVRSRIRFVVIVPPCGWRRQPPHARSRAQRATGACFERLAAPRRAWHSPPYRPIAVARPRERRHARARSPSARSSASA